MENFDPVERHARLTLEVIRERFDTRTLTHDDFNVLIHSEPPKEMNSRPSGAEAK